jgi:hypothetical protein
MAVLSTALKPKHRLLTIGASVAVVQVGGERRRESELPSGHSMATRPPRGTRVVARSGRAKPGRHGLLLSEYSHVRGKVRTLSNLGRERLQN